LFLFNSLTLYKEFSNSTVTDIQFLLKEKLLLFKIFTLFTDAGLQLPQEFSFILVFGYRNISITWPWQYQMYIGYLWNFKSKFLIRSILNKTWTNCK